MALLEQQQQICLPRVGLTSLWWNQNKDIWDIPRAVHFDGQTQRIFQSMGIMDQIDKIIDPATEVKFLDAKGKELIHLGGMNEGYQLNGYVEDVFFNQPKFEKILRDNAKKYENIDLKLGYELINLEANDGINNLKIVNSSSEECLLQNMF